MARGRRDRGIAPAGGRPGKPCAERGGRPPRGLRGPRPSGGRPFAAAAAPSSAVRQRRWRHARRRTGFAGARPGALPAARRCRVAAVRWAAPGPQVRGDRSRSPGWPRAWRRRAGAAAHTGGRDGVDPVSVVAFGAHPDDDDIKVGGTAALWAARGDRVLFVSVANGDAGHQTQGGGELARRRRAEAEAAGRVLGVRYEVLDHHDGALEPTLELRREVI